MRMILFSLLGLASVLSGCGPGLDTDSFHPGSIDGALFWYKAEQASLPPGSNSWSWSESLGNQTDLPFTGAGTPSIYPGSQGQNLLNLPLGSYFSSASAVRPISLGEFTVYAVMQRKENNDGGIFGVLSGNVSPTTCPSANLSLRVTSTGLLVGEVWNDSSSISASLPAGTELSVLEFRYGSDGALRLQAAGQSSSASGAAQSISIAFPYLALGAACSGMSGTPVVSKGNLSLGEVLFYNRAVSDSESLRIRRYLMLRHGVTQ